MSCLCTSCGKSFSTKGNLQRHKKNITACKDRSKPSMTKEHKCHKCDKIFTRQDNLVKHLKTVKCIKPLGIKINEYASILESEIAETKICQRYIEDIEKERAKRALLLTKLSTPHTIPEQSVEPDVEEKKIEPTIINDNSITISNSGNSTVNNTTVTVNLLSMDPDKLKQELNRLVTFDHCATAHEGSFADLFHYITKGCVGYDGKTRNVTVNINGKELTQDIDTLDWNLFKLAREPIERYFHEQDGRHNQEQFVSNCTDISKIVKSNAKNKVSSATNGKMERLLNKDHLSELMSNMKV